jgi:hypothetical protein
MIESSDTFGKDRILAGKLFKLILAEIEML